MSPYFLGSGLKKCYSRVVCIQGVVIQRVDSTTYIIGQNPGTTQPRSMQMSAAVWGFFTDIAINVFLKEEFLFSNLQLLTNSLVLILVSMQRQQWSVSRSMRLNFVSQNLHFFSLGGVLCSKYLMCYKSRDHLQLLMPYN